MTQSDAEEEVQPEDAPQDDMILIFRTIQDVEHEEDVQDGMIPHMALEDSLEQFSDLFQLLSVDSYIICLSVVELETKYSA